MALGTRRGLTCEELPPLLGNRWRRAPLRLARSHFADLARWHCMGSCRRIWLFRQAQIHVPVLCTYAISETPPWRRPSPSLTAVRARAAAASEMKEKSKIRKNVLECRDGLLSTMAVDLAVNQFGGGGGGVVVRLKQTKRKANKQRI